MDKQPESFKLRDASLEQVDRKILKEIDRASLLARDRESGKSPERPGPMRFAVSDDVEFSITNCGTWRELPNGRGRVWRLVIQAPGAVSLNLGLARFEMPEGAQLWVYDPARQRVAGPYTARHRSPKGRLWTPVIPGDEIVVEVFVPTGAGLPEVIVGHANKGYRTAD